MERLTDSAWQKVVELSGRYGVSTDAVLSLLQSVVNGNGTMAQFFHNELGGGGQWMQGGMTMVGDMFNYGLKSKVDGLCTELSNLLQTAPFVPRPIARSMQGQGQGFGGQMQGQGGQMQMQGSGGSFGGSFGSWWPGELGSPNGSGGQNNIRYAYFNGPHRLAVELDGVVTVYDTLDNNIGGVSQQQGGNNSLTLSSQYGTIAVSSLPIVSVNGVPRNSGGNNAGNQNFASPPPAPAPQQNFNPPPQQQNPPPQQNFAPSGNMAQEADIFAKIERLAELQQKGILSVDEFAAKKSELLSRL